MKTIIAIILSLFIIGCQCSKPTDVPVVTTGNETNQTIVPSNISPSDVVVEEKREVTIVRYHWVSGDVYFSVMFRIVTNQNHPFGFVIIHKISRNDKSWTVDCFRNAPEYISTIHNISNFSLSETGTENSFKLSDPIILPNFRTAEAMIIAANQQEVSVSEEDVYTAGQSMISDR